MLVIKNVSLPNRDRSGFDKSDILVRDSYIEAIEPTIESSSTSNTLDAKGYIALPGMVNSHSHSHCNLVKATASNWTLEDVLNYGPASYGNRSAEDHYLSAMLGAIEMIRTGTTAVYDLVAGFPHSLEALDAVARAYADIGLRATIAPAVTDIPFYSTVPSLVERLPDRNVPSTSLQSADELVDISRQFILDWHNKAKGTIQCAVAPTIPVTCSDDLLKRLAELARQFDTGYHTHLAESAVQVAEGKRRWGSTIVEALERLGVLGPKFLGAHGVFLTEQDSLILAKHKASVAHCPASNLRLGNGIAPVREMLNAGVSVSLATDGAICSDNQNMFEAMRFGSMVSTFGRDHQTENWLDATETIAMATLGGAKSLGLSGQVGALEVGYKADITLLDGKSIAMTPMTDLHRNLVYSENGQSVRSVIINGRLIMHEGELLTVDERSLIARAGESAVRARERNIKAWELPQEVAPYLRSACQSITGPANSFEDQGSVHEHG